MQINENCNINFGNVRTLGCDKFTQDYAIHGVHLTMASYLFLHDGLFALVPAGRRSSVRSCYSFFFFRVSIWMHRTTLQGVIYNGWRQDVESIRARKSANGGKNVEPILPFRAVSDSTVNRTLLDVSSHIMKDASSTCLSAMTTMRNSSQSPKAIFNTWKTRASTY